MQVNYTVGTKLGKFTEFMWLHKIIANSYSRLASRASAGLSEHAKRIPMAHSDPLSNTRWIYGQLACIAITQIASSPLRMHVRVQVWIDSLPVFGKFYG